MLHINELKPEILRAAVFLKVGDSSTEGILRKKNVSKFIFSK